MKTVKGILFLLLWEGGIIFGQSTVQNYYPLHVGDYWIMVTDSSENGTLTDLEEIEGTDMILGNQYYRRKTTLTASDGSKRSSWYTWEGINANGNVIIATGDTSILDSATIYNPPLLWIADNLLNPGYTWSFYTELFGGNCSLSIKSISATVQVPAGTFSNCLEINLLITGLTGDTVQTTSIYFASGVGNVLKSGWSKYMGNFNYRLIEYAVHSNLPDNHQELPTDIFLAQNYPNPFNPVTNIHYRLPASSLVCLYIYNLTGQELVRLVEEFQQPGDYAVQWDSRNYPAGIYLYRISTGNYSATRKCLLLK